MLKQSKKFCNLHISAALFLYLYIFQKNNKSEPVANRHKVRICLLWWRRGESNPCPKTDSHELLRVQSLLWDSPHIAPKDRLYATVASKS